LSLHELKSVIWRWALLLLVAGLALELFFALRLTAMLWLDPQSTTFQRSEAWRLSSLSKASDTKSRWVWRQQWVPYSNIADSLKRAVIASEDSEFANHDGVDWDAMENAWQSNAKAQAALERQKATAAKGVAQGKRGPKIIGGSTISQQLAKNLFLSGERTLLRKAQELVLTLMLEKLLGKERILEIYLNSVEWGSGVFGAEAAAQRYFGKSASQLSNLEAARLAVMLPRPKYFEKLPNSDYVAHRAEVIVARMPQVDLP